MAKNPFQQAVVELNCLITGKDPETLKALGGERFVRFLRGTKDAQEGDEESPLALFVHGYGQVEGSNLEDAVTKMKARISGNESSSNDAPAKSAGKRSK